MPCQQGCQSWPDLHIFRALSILAWLWDHMFHFVCTYAFVCLFIHLFVSYWMDRMKGRPKKKQTRDNQFQQISIACTSINSHGQKRSVCSWSAWNRIDSYLCIQCFRLYLQRDPFQTCKYSVHRDIPFENCMPHIVHWKNNSHLSMPLKKKTKTK